MKRGFVLVCFASIAIFACFWIILNNQSSINAQYCSHVTMCAISKPDTADVQSETNNSLTFNDAEKNSTHLLEINRETLADFSKFLRSEIRNIRRVSSKQAEIGQILDRMDRFSGEFINFLKIHNDLLQRQNGRISRRKRQLRRITNGIQWKITFLQNDPSMCYSPSKVLLCELTNLAGFASGIHDVLSCFVEAFYSGKRVVLDVSKWHYTTGRDWTSVGFRPLSDTCKDTNFKNTNVTKGPPTNGDAVRNKLVHFPLDIRDELLSLGIDPLPWWWGQFVGYILRPNINLWKYVEDLKKRIGFTSPIVGIHIRRTDKVLSEAKLHSNEEYMQEVEHYFNQLDMARELSSDQSSSPARNASKSIRNVFVATDDPVSIKALKQNYPAYNFISQDESIAKLAQKQKTRYNNASLYGILVDLQLLGDSDYLVCTLSSGFCRLAFALSNYLKTTRDHTSETAIFEVLPKVYSLDVPLHYTYILPPKRVVTLSHIAEGPDQLSALAGDILETSDQFHFENEAKRGKYEDGFSTWTNSRTGKTGTIPNFKTKEIFLTEG